MSEDVVTIGHEVRENTPQQNIHGITTTILKTTDDQTTKLIEACELNGNYLNKFKLYCLVCRMKIVVVEPFSITGENKKRFDVDIVESLQCGTKKVHYAVLCYCC